MTLHAISEAPASANEGTEGESSSGERRFWRDPLIWLLLFLALLLRVGYNLALKQDALDWYSFVIDEREYFGAAHMFAEGRGFTFFDTALWVRPPLYVALLGVLLRFGQDTYLPVLMIQSVLSAGTLLPLGLIAYRLGSRPAARCCVAIGAFYLPFALFAGLLLSETLFIFLLGWALLALDKSVSSLSLVWLGLAGMMLGTAALTRATALGFVPLAALWIYIMLRRGRRISTPKSLALAGLLLVVPLALLVPWTLRNWAAYGRFIPLDTTSGYNLWLGSVGVRDEPRLQADLLAIENQGDRQAYALARGWENIARDPLAFVGKGMKESLDLLRPSFSSEERQVRGYASGRVPAWHLISLFVFDDLLYLLILVAAATGLLVSAATPMRFLTVLWVLMWVAVAFIFFAVTRFRLPIVAALLPWAGAGTAYVASLMRTRAMFSHLAAFRRIGLVCAYLLIAVLVLPGVPLEDTLLGVQRWAAQAPFRRGEDLLAQGRLPEAIAQYNSADNEVPDTRYALAAAYLQQGKIENGLAELVDNEPERRFEPFLIRGEAARRSGDLGAARSFFNHRTVNLAGDEALRWAWDHLNPPPVDSIEVGSGLDIGYIKGFYNSESESERQYRWSSDKMQVRGLRMARSDGVTIEASGWRPEIVPAARLTLDAITKNGAQIDERLVIILPLDPLWTSTKVDRGNQSTSPATGSGFRAAVNSFIGSGRDPRLLGVRVTRISVEP